MLKNEAVLHDGTKQQMYDGTARAAAWASRARRAWNHMLAAAGPGPTGTYTARYTWYDEDARA